MRRKKRKKAPKRSLPQEKRGLGQVLGEYLSSVAQGVGEMGKSLAWWAGYLSPVKFWRRARLRRKLGGLLLLFSDLPCLENKAPLFLVRTSRFRWMAGI